MRRGLALLVGVDRYKHFSHLKSCANDARLMAHALIEKFGFVEEDLTFLLDEAATREGILKGLRDLQNRAQAGDSVIFYYSGHGSRITDLDGDETDGWDETIVPYDSGRHPNPNHDVIDDEIHDWLLQISAITPNVTVIADTCYSGGVIRSGREKWVEPGLRTETRLRTSAKTRENGPSGFLPESERYTLLAACRAQETAKVLAGQPYSAFTFFLCQELLRAPKDATYREVMERTRIAVAATPEAKNQTPQLEGARDRLLFGLESIEPARYLPIETKEGNRVRLGGGIVHGVDQGSQWEIYPAGTRQPEEGKALGVVLVAEVQAVSAQAEILDEKSPILPGARAFEKLKGPGWMRLTVAIETPDLDRATVIDLSRRIERSQFLRVAEDPAQADARIVMAGQGTETSWRVLDVDGEPLIPSIPSRQPGSVARLTGDLETRARYLNLLRLTADDEGNPLRGCLEVQLLRRSDGGEFRPARPRKEGEVVYRAGEYLALRASHRAARPLYIHVLDLGLTGAISLLHPVAGFNKPLLPKRDFEVGVRQRIKIRVPDGFPDGGREFLKVIATTHEADLSWLQQRGFGSAPPSGGQPRSGVASLLWRALGGGSRQSLPPPLGEDEGWTVVPLDFLIR